MYSSKSWAIIKKQKSKLQACEIKILRKIQGVTKLDKVRNEKVRRGLKIKSKINKIEAQQLRWFKHVTRMRKGKHKNHMENETSRKESQRKTQS